MTRKESTMRRQNNPAQRLQAALQTLGDAKYHHRHPFNLLMHAGRLTASDLRLWVANRYYYQTRIPIKDALIVAKSEDPHFRRAWLQRIIDHDGPSERTTPPEASNHREVPRGGLKLWQELGRACGIRKEDLDAHRWVIPAARQVCDEYVELVRGADLLTAVASSLTEYFAGSILQVRLDAWKAHYPWVPPEALSYFECRLAKAPADAEYALKFLELQLHTDEQFERCLHAVERKCDILWRLLDVVYLESRRRRVPRLTGRVALYSAEPPASALLLAPEKGYELNETGHALLELCKDEQPLEELARRLAQQYQGQPETVLAEMAPFVAELERRRVIEFAPEL